MGADNDAMVVSDKFGVKEYIVRNIQDTFQKAGMIDDLYKKYKIHGGNADATGGYSLGLVDVMKSKNITLGRVNFGQKAFNEDLYPNARTEMYLEAARPYAKVSGFQTRQRKSSLQ